MIISSEDIRKFRENLDISQQRLAEVVGVSLRTIQNYEAGGTIPKSKHAIFHNLFKDGLPSFKIPKDFVETLKESTAIYNTNGNRYIELKDGSFDVETPIIPFSAYASYLESMEVGTVYEDFETMTFNVDHIGKGNYRAFLVKGDSMNGGKLNDTPDGAKVLGRELQQTHWKDGFYDNDYGWIILSKHNIFHKDIIDLDLETGEITCHSRNTSPEYSDFKINLNDCYKIFKVIKRIF